MKRLFLLALSILVLTSLSAAAQKRIAGFIEPMPTEKLKRLFPSAVRFSPRGEVDPLYFTAFAADERTPGAKPIGYAFWTTDIVPEELGYHGHIHMLIGMDTVGKLTGVIVDVNTEPYGDISVELPEFAAQFKGKSIRDPFVPGQDVDAVSAGDNHRAGSSTGNPGKLANHRPGRVTARGRQALATVWL